MGIAESTHATRWQRFVVITLCVHLLLIGPSCATIVSGTSQSVTVISEPSGARVSVGSFVGTTPATFSLKRGSSYLVVVTKDGFDSAQATIGKSFNGWFLGNLLLGGIIGMIVDIASGSWMHLDSDMVSVTLQPNATATGPIPPPTVTSADATVTSLGTAFLFGPNQLLTVYHVVAHATSISVVAQDGTLTDASIIASDESNDICVLQVAGQIDGTILPLAGDEPIPIGSKVFLLGYPLQGELKSADPVIGEGIIASLQGLRGDLRHLQLTAAMNPGNSGGPVLDGSGRVIAMASHKLSDLYGIAEQNNVPQGTNFAIKTDLIRTLLRSRSIDCTATTAGSDRLDAESLYRAASRGVFRIRATVDRKNVR